MEIRSKLEPLLNIRNRFGGIFLRYGKFGGYNGNLRVTLILKDVFLVESPNDILTDHLWFNYTKGFQKLALQSGDIVHLNGRVDLYQKGYSDDCEDNPIRFDYHLKYPRKVVKVGKADKYEDYDEYNLKLLADVESYNQNLFEERKNWAIEQQNKSQKISSENEGENTFLDIFLQKIKK